MMNKMKTSALKFVGVVIIVVLAGALYYAYIFNSSTIKSIVLSSPNNYAFQEDINVVLKNPRKIFIRYWKEGSNEVFETHPTEKAKAHTVRLLLLQTDSKYVFQVFVEGFINISSDEMSFQTRKQSPWLIHNWVNNDMPHDASMLDNGMVMICNARLPGYIAMIDGKGAIRWYWQTDDIGVRAATFTPRGTLLAMLRPPVKDVIDDTPQKEVKILNEMDKPTRRGAMGFAGGTEIAEIDLKGNMLWRWNIDSVTHGKFRVLHHDIRMDKNHHILTMVRTSKVYDMSKIGGAGIDTLGGDGILLMDTTGKVLWKWDVWDHWDIQNDPYILKFAYDRFHFNSINIDKDGNYIVSVAIEDQIWKINSTTGDIMWKLGKGGDFKMDTSCYFSFQHSVHINPEGDLQVFDNSIWNKQSGTLSFHLDTVNKIATTKIKAMLPRSKYSSRMGSGYLLPNGKLLQTSSKTGTVMVTDQKGNILWQLNSYFVPYRAEYVPDSLWEKYYIKK